MDSSLVDVLVKSALRRGDGEELKKLLLDETKKYSKLEKQLDKIVKLSDIQSKKLQETTQELNEYKNLLEEKVREQVNEIELLYTEISNAQKDIIFTLGAVGELRSKETGAHVTRVSEYSYAFAKMLGISEKEATLIKDASSMHDIGKVAIPDSILLKPGKLDECEFEIMKNHALIGYSMLAHSDKDLLKAASIISLEHHEKWDGSGYPYSKSAKNIHIYGRITAIADVFDALGTKRVYKEAWSAKQILEYFKENKGVQFDPDLVDMLLKNHDKFFAIKSKYSDK